MGPLNVAASNCAVLFFCVCFYFMGPRIWPTGVILIYHRWYEVWKSLKVRAQKPSKSSQCPVICSWSVKVHSVSSVVHITCIIQMRHVALCLQPQVERGAPVQGQATGQSWNTALQGFTAAMCAGMWTSWFLRGDIEFYCRTEAVCPPSMFGSLATSVQRRRTARRRTVGGTPGVKRAGNQRAADQRGCEDCTAAITKSGEQKYLFFY